MIESRLSYSKERRVQFFWPTLHIDYGKPVSTCTERYYHRPDIYVFSIIQLTLTLPAASPSEVTTKRRYTNRLLLGLL